MPGCWLVLCSVILGLCYWLAESATITGRTIHINNAHPRYVTRSIEDIREGDFVLAREEFGQRLSPQRVLEVYRRTSDHLRILSFQAKDGTEHILQTTDEHPFWCENRQAWIEAQQLAVGDVAIAPCGERHRLTSTIRRHSLPAIAVFNLHVDNYHSYFAGQTADLSVLVHNATYPGRLGKQARLRELLDDYRTSSADRGWIQQEVNAIERGQRTRIRVPPGKNLAHQRGYEAKNGYSYRFSDLQDVDLHKLQHHFEGK